MALFYLFLILMQPAPRLYVVTGADTVMPGQVFSVTVTRFDVEGPVTFDSGGLEVLSQEQAPQTLYVTLRAAGEPRDVTVRAWAGGVGSEAIIRICCRESAAPVNPARRVWLAAFYH